MTKFNEIYETVYKKSFEIMENKRKDAQNRIILVFVLAISIGIIISIISKSIIPTLLGIIVAVLYSAISRKNRDYKTAYKELVIKNLIKEYDSNLEFRAHSEISSTIYSMGEFERFDRYYSEDYIGGLLNDGRTIVMAEVHTEDETTDDEGNTSYTTLFHGLFARVELNKIIPTTTKIRKNKLKLIDSKARLEMDSGEFEKIFDVYSEGKITTMQLLTLDIMQMMVEFKEKNKVVPEMTIKDNNLYIRFATGSIFEGDLLKSSLDYNTLKEYYDIIDFIVKITDELLKNVEDAGI